jgi:hypothetical protein
MIMFCPDCRTSYHSTNGVIMRCTACTDAHTRTREWLETTTQADHDIDLNRYREEMSLGGQTYDPIEQQKQSGGV